MLVTVHAKRGKDGTTAAGVLPSFGGIAVHDAWKPYDSYVGVAGHALCNSHLLRELIAVTETGTALDRAWAQQTIDALLALKDAAEAAREAGHAIDQQVRAEHEDWFPQGCRHRDRITRWVLDRISRKQCCSRAARAHRKRMESTTGSRHAPRVNR